MPEPLVISAEARAAAADGPMPLTDAAAHAAATAAVKPDGLPQRHPAAGTRAEARLDELKAVVSGDARLIEGMRLQILDLERQLKQAGRRVADFEAWALTPDDGTCPGCAGHRRTIAEMEKADVARRRRIAGLELTVRALGAEPQPTT